MMKRHRLSKTIFILITVCLIFKLFTGTLLPSQKTIKSEDGKIRMQNEKVDSKLDLDFKPFELANKELHNKVKSFDPEFYVDDAEVFKDDIVQHKKEKQPQVDDPVPNFDEEVEVDKMIVEKVEKDNILEVDLKHEPSDEKEDNDDQDDDDEEEDEDKKKKKAKNMKSDLSDDKLGKKKVLDDDDEADESKTKLKKSKKKLKVKGSKFGKKDENPKNYQPKSKEKDTSYDEKVEKKEKEKKAKMGKKIEEQVKFHQKEDEKKDLQSHVESKLQFLSDKSGKKVNDNIDEEIIDKLMESKDDPEIKEGKMDKKKLDANSMEDIDGKVEEKFNQKKKGAKIKADEKSNEDDDKEDIPGKVKAVLEDQQPKLDSKGQKLDEALKDDENEDLKSKEKEKKVKSILANEKSDDLISEDKLKGEKKVVESEDKEGDKKNEKISKVEADDPSKIQDAGSDDKKEAIKSNNGDSKMKSKEKKDDSDDDKDYQKKMDKLKASLESNAKESPNVNEKEVASSAKKKLIRDDNADVKVEVVKHDSESVDSNVDDDIEDTDDYDI